MSSTRHGAPPPGDGVVQEQSVRRASALMAAGSIVSRPLGLVRQLMLVACLGVTGATADAFNTANQLPNIIYMLLSGGLLTAVLIPQITKAMKREDGGQEVIDRLLTICIGAILLPIGQIWFSTQLLSIGTAPSSR